MPDWLLHNPIADMRGPVFLGFYAITLLATIIVCHRLSRGGDPANVTPPPVPPEPDPFEIAYLRGGEREVMNVAVLSLMRRGFVQVSANGKKMEPTANAPPARHLAGVERTVFDWLGTPQDAAKLFQTELPAEIRTAASAYRPALEAEQLLTMPAMRQAAWRALGAGLAVTLGLGGYKLLVALQKGRTNVALLIVLGIMAIIILSIVCRPARLTKRGQAYLQALQLAFEKLKTRVAETTNTPAVGGETAPAADMTPLLLLGLFGAGALTTTAYANYGEFQRQAQAQSLYSGGSCGSTGSWSSSCSGGSSCGSSCGGGGCGGGCGGCGG